jgi:hypothetical protein
MTNRSNLRRGLILGLLCSIPACASTASKLQARFAREQACPADLVRVSDEGGQVYRARGCDRSTEYICESFAGMGDPSKGCRERGLSPHEPSGNPPPQPQPAFRPELVAPK